MFAAAAALSFTCAAFAEKGSGKDDAARPPKILEFQTMAGVSRPYTGATNAIRGVAGGGLPWVLTSAKGELDITGKLEIEVTGLVFDPADAAVIAAGLANRNTVPSFRATVSCLSRDTAGAPTTVNVSTGSFPATQGTADAGGGNAKIEAWLQLPSPCIAPIAFVTSPGGAWFASTGH